MVTTIEIKSDQITSSTTIKPAIAAWKNFLEDQSRSIHTIKAFIADLNLLESYIPPDRELGAITTIELNNFLSWMQSGRGIPCSPKTLARRITSIKSFFRWLNDKGVILSDPADGVLQKSVLSPLPQVLTPDEVEAVIASAKKLRNEDKPDTRAYLLVSLLLETGIKKGECLSIAPNHIDLNSPGGPIIFVRYSSPKMRYKERKISLSQEWIDSFKEYKKQHDISDRLFPWSPRRLEYILEDLGKDAGLDKHLSFLMCRWTCALTDFTDGIEPNKIRQKLGVSEIQFRELKMKLARLAKEQAPREPITT